MSNKKMRELRETENLFKDPKYCREAWRSVGNAILNNPCACLPLSYEKTGEISYSSMLEGYSYEKLTEDIRTLGDKNRKPTELEMILMCQIVKARYDTSAAIFVRDTLGAKPVDESKVDTTVNTFESLTDEELELLAKHRTEKQGAALSGASSDAPLEHPCKCGENKCDE